MSRPDAELVADARKLLTGWTDSYFRAETDADRRANLFRYAGIRALDSLSSRADRNARALAVVCIDLAAEVTDETPGRFELRWTAEYAIRLLRLLDTRS